MKRAMILALALAGCAADPAVRVETQTVRVPVACVDADVLPAKPEPLGPRPSDDARVLLDLAMAKLVELLGPDLDGRGGYVGEADAVLTGCARK